MQNFNSLLKNAKRQPGLDLTGLALVLYPYYYLNREQPYLASAYVISVKDGDAVHQVVVSFTEIDNGARLGSGTYQDADDNSLRPQFSIWCADNFFEGRHPRAEAEARSRRAVSHLANSSTLTDEQRLLVDKMMAGFGALPASGPCDFWSEWRRNHKLCKHTEHVLACLREMSPNFQKHLEESLVSALAAFPEYMAIRESRKHPAPASKPAPAPDLAVPMRRFASAFVGLGLSMAGYHVEDAPYPDYTVLPVYRTLSQDVSDAVFFVNVKYAPSRQAAMDAYAKRMPGAAIHRGVIIAAYNRTSYSVFVTPEGDLVTHPELAAILQKAEHFSKFKVLAL